MLDRLELPEDWKRRTPVFVTKAKVREGVTPLVSRETYELERGQLSRRTGFPMTDQGHKARSPGAAC